MSLLPDAMAAQSFNLQVLTSPSTGLALVQRLKSCPTIRFSRDGKTIFTAAVTVDCSVLDDEVVKQYAW